MTSVVPFDHDEEAQIKTSENISEEKSEPHDATSTSDMDREDLPFSAKPRGGSTKQSIKEGTICEKEV